MAIHVDQIYVKELTLSTSPSYMIMDIGFYGSHINGSSGSVISGAVAQFNANKQTINLDITNNISYNNSIVYAYEEDASSIILYNGTVKNSTGLAMRLLPDGNSGLGYRVERFSITLKYVVYGWY